MDINTFLQKNQQSGNKKFVFGENISTNISLENCNWFYGKNERICRIEIESEAAKTLNIKLTNFHLSPTAEMFLYDEKGFMKAGPITAKENNAEEIFLSDIFSIANNRQQYSKVSLIIDSDTAEKKYRGYRQRCLRKKESTISIAILLI